jgi:hypothetical protein
MDQAKLKQACCIAFTTVAALTLQGCIAAAFPLAAGGLIGERSLSRGGESVAETEAIVEVAETSADQQLVNSDLAPVDSELVNASPPATQARADFNAAFTETEVAANAPMPVSAQPRPIETPAPVQAAQPAEATAQAPAPVARVVRPLPTPVPSTREPFGPSGITQLLSYANSREVSTEEEPASAMLSDRVALEPTKALCSGVSPTILIDLDPEGALFDSTTASRPPSGLARGLSQLRESGVNVAWISGNGIDELDAIKRALTYSGLDLGNEDRVLLVRSPDDRKQTLREELAQISCLIAIAGDTRSDFDELYDYLKNPSDAEKLEPLIGDGWFIIPQPLL